MTPTWFDLQIRGDDRGSLIAIEEGKNIPFEIRRVYYIFDTKSGVERGFHAHKKLNQLCVAVRGSCAMTLDDGKQKIEVLMNRPNQGLVVEPGIWHEMRDFSEDCVLMVLADDLYDAADYIRDYEEFLRYASPPTL